MSQMQFDDAVGVVTGAGNGMGASIARSLAKNGAKVVVTDIDGEAAKAVADSIVAGGGEAIGLDADVTDPERMFAVADTAFDRFGKVDILANNAGVTMRPFRAIWEASAQDFEWMMRVNYFGIVNGLRAFLPRMLEANDHHRHIVNTSSMATLMETHGHAMYAASKGAVDALSDSLRTEFVDHGQDFGVTVLFPGPVATEIMFRSENYRPESDRSKNRDVKPYPVANKDGHKAPDAIGPEPVGDMVIRAVQVNAPYVVTHPADAEFLQRRLDAVLGGYFPEEVAS